MVLKTAQHAPGRPRRGCRVGVAVKRGAKTLAFFALTVVAALIGAYGVTAGNAAVLALVPVPLFAVMALAFGIAWRRS